MAVDVLEALVSLDYDFMGVAPLIGDDAHESVVDRRSAAPLVAGSTTGRKRPPTVRTRFSRSASPTSRSIAIESPVEPHSVFIAVTGRLTRPVPAGSVRLPKVREVESRRESR
jgi:hypothetical protein